ncbi:MAG: hypothetical protein AAB019_04470 [Planctomycetota bacterium]
MKEICSLTKDGFPIWEAGCDGVVVVRGIFVFKAGVFFSGLFDGTIEAADKGVVGCRDGGRGAFFTAVIGWYPGPDTIGAGGGVDLTPDNFVFISLIKVNNRALMKKNMPPDRKIKETALNKIISLVPSGCGFDNFIKQSGTDRQSKIYKTPNNFKNIFIAEPVIFPSFFLLPVGPAARKI